MNNKELEQRMTALEQLNRVRGLQFTGPFSEWPKDHQVEYNVLHEIVFREGVKFPPVKGADGLKYSEAEIEKARSEFYKRQG